VVARAGCPGGPARRRGRELSPLDQESEFARLGSELCDSVVEAVPGWIVGAVVDRYADWVRSGGASDPEVQAGIARLAEIAGRQAAAEVADPLRMMLAGDVDDQHTTPLALVRPLVAFATAVLAQAGVPSVVRDEFQVRRFPDDEYGLTPASLAALGDRVGDLAIAWGSAKAMAHRRRHQR
jgi:hypothetical protein